MYGAAKTHALTTLVDSFSNSRWIATYGNREGRGSLLHSTHSSIQGPCGLFALAIKSNARLNGAGFVSTIQSEIPGTLESSSFSFAARALSKAIPLRLLVFTELLMFTEP